VTQESEEDKPPTIISVLNQALKGADEDKQKILDSLETIKTNKDDLKEMLDQPYFGKPGEDIPAEFKNPQEFLRLWDALDEALGNTILMVMPPSIFESTELESVKKEEEKPSSPVIVVGPEKKIEQQQRQASRGFLSGLWDYKIEKLKFTARKAEKPVITTGIVTYNPKDVVYQLIPSLNQLKEMYFRFLRRHISSQNPSPFLLKLGHIQLQEEMSKYFNVVYPFCRASIIFQTEKIRRDKMRQVTQFTRIAEAEAMAQSGREVIVLPGKDKSRTP